jgi:hypothetical protein
MAEENITPSISFLPPQKSGLVDLDLNKMRGDGFDDSEIAKFVISQYKPRSNDGVYYDLDEKYYDALKQGLPADQTQSGRPLRPLSDREIIAQYSTARDIPELQYIAEQSVKGLVPGAGTVSGAYLGASFGPGGMILGGLAGGFGSDILMRQAAPEIYEDYVGDTATGEAVRFFSESVPALAVPWMVPEKAMINLGSNFISRNASRIPFGSKISSGLEKGESYVRQAFDFARQNPRTYLGTETKDILTASGVAGAFEALSPGDRGALSDTLQLGVEVGASVLQPLDVAGRLLYNNTGSFGRFLQNINQQSRIEYTGNKFLEFLKKGGEDPEVFLELVKAINRGESTPETELLKEAGIDFNDTTSALKTGVPVLFLLESLGLEQKMQWDLSTPVVRTPDRDITRRQQDAFQAFNNLLGQLLKVDNPDALGLYQDLRDAGFRAEINSMVTTAINNYERVSNNALASGETFDSQAVLFEMFFGDNGVAAKIDRQANVLKNLIPKDINVPNSALQTTTTGGEVAGNLLVDVFNRIGNTAAIRGIRPRLSYGKDLISLDKVLKEFDVLVNPEKYAKADDLPKLPEQQLELKFDTVSAPSPEAPEPQELTSGELLNFLDQIDQSKRQALRSGNKPLLTLLAELEEGAKNSLRAVSQNRNMTTPGGQFKPYFDNYLAFRDEANNVFSNAFLQDMRSDIPKELAGNVLFSSMGDVTLLRLQEMDKAADFILNFDQRKMGTLGQSNELAAASGQFSEDGIIEPGQVMEDLVESGLPLPPSLTGEAPASNIPVIRASQDRVLRGMLDNPSYFKREPLRDADGRIIMIEDPENPDQVIPKTRKVPTAKFNTFLSDPEIDRVLTNYFPDLRNDLRDVNRFAALLENAELEEGFFNKGILQRDAFSEYFSGVYEDPVTAIQQMIGDPGSGKKPGAKNPVKALTEAAQIAVNSGDEKVIQGFLDTVFANGYTRAGANSAPLQETGLPPFDLEQFKFYLNTPIVPGTSGDSILQVLSKTGILEEGNTHIAKINKLIDVLDQINTSSRPGRLASVEQRVLDRRKEAGLEPLDGNIVSGGGVNEITDMIERGGISLVGSALGSAVYSLFSRVIPGASGNLIAPVIGKNILTKLLSDQPGLLANQMMTEMLKDTKLLETVLEIAMSPEKTLRDLDSAQLRRMYTFFMGSGLVNPDIGFQEFASDIYGRTRDPEERRAQREEAGAAPMVPQRPNPRRVQPSIVPPAQPVTPPPQAAAPRPMPPPVAQAPAPTAQAPANPNQRARYAAMFPNDTASGLIRQGIGSLS